MTLHVDAVKSSHEDKVENDEFQKWCEEQYENEENGLEKVVRVNKHNYLEMILDCFQIGGLKIDMKYYIENMEDKFSNPIKSRTKSPWTEKLFKVDDSYKILDQQKNDLFHSFTMRMIFLIKKLKSGCEPGCKLFVHTCDILKWKQLVKAIEDAGIL